MKYRTIATALAIALCGSVTTAQADIANFGPGGPITPMREASQAFETETGIAVTVAAGPTPQWVDAAKTDADAILSGSQNMVGDSIGAIAMILPDNVTPLHLRPSAIVVRKGNPRRHHRHRRDGGLTTLKCASAHVPRLLTGSSPSISHRQLPFGHSIAQAVYTAHRRAAPRNSFLGCHAPP